MNQPSKEDWASLYQAAIAFGRAAPWEWVDSYEIFGIENPDGGEVGYCSILGSGGEEFGLGIFLGDDGYQIYARLIEEEADPRDFEEVMMARSISLLFADRDLLKKEDREVIRSLDLRFRGKNAWPLFRSQLPGYFPWFLEKAEAVFLTAAIKQALVVADKVIAGEVDLLEGEAKDLILVRYCRGGRWRQEWRKAPTESQTPAPSSQDIDAVQQAELHLLRSRKGELSGCLELDIFALPMPIGKASERRYFPVCFLAVETEVGLVLGTKLTGPWLDLSQKRNEVIQLLTKAEQLPGEVRVRSNKVREIVEPITSILGIKLTVDSLPRLEEAKAGLFEHLSGR